MTTSGLLTTAIGDALRLAEHFADQPDLHAVNVSVSTTFISVQVADDTRAVTLRVAHGMLEDPTVVVRSYETSHHVIVTGTYRGVKVEVYRGFWEIRDRHLLDAYLMDAPADARLLDVLAGDPPIAALRSEGISEATLREVRAVSDEHARRVRVWKPRERCANFHTGQPGVVVDVDGNVDELVWVLYDGAPEVVTVSTTALCDPPAAAAGAS